jgi:small subunit ribosomal protein S16
MATAIRLARRGSKKYPTYRIVVADSRAPRDGRFIESIGYYNPQQEPSLIEIDAAKAQDWLAKGAQPSDAVRKLLKAKGLS